MTEAEWISSEDPSAMLGRLRVMPGLAAGTPSDRKLRLWCHACACLTSEGVPFAEGIRERYDDWLENGLKDPTHKDTGLTCSANWASQHPFHWKMRAHLLRDIVGNPWRPVTLPKAAFSHRDTWASGMASAPVATLGYECPWLTPQVLSLAQAAYEERRPDGTLDPLTLAAVADALEEAGCADDVFLGHLRSPGPHVRGCWALDLILGKG